ncbi:ABC transporter ATP-binding protein [Kurthia sibirica]|uniref:Multidrug ABC transporter ATP-binding protein n=1 Tax=Kurthia sibirica TaxID=202750 RepID=A0A2U3ANF3_9BACL|nr:ABC transporter ATP-binding protein [Kurthia sibirica]PWI26036.1 multidrug ABC transporter ATP-binding protein [Kurthia sibirica]GEK34563.1 multidrug ABC transporter ATP-binding protein [Kurthia sibirica]
MYKKFFSYYKPYKRLFVIDFASAIIVALLELVFPVAVQRFIDTLLPTNNWSMITKVAILLLIIYLVSTVLSFVVNYWGHKLGTKIETDMREELFLHTQRQSFKFFDNTKTGHLMGRITTDLFDIGEFAHHGPEDLFIAIMTFIGAFMIMFTINPMLALIILLFVPLMILVITIANKRMHKTWGKLYAKVGDINGRVEDAISGMRVVKSFTNEEHEAQRFREQNRSFLREKLIGYKTMSSTNAAIYIMTRLLTLIVLIVGTWMTFHERMTAGELISFILFTSVLIKPIDKISALLELYPKGMAGFKRFRELIERDPDIVDAPDAVDVPLLKGDVDFEHVTFKYDTGKTILNDLTFSIRSGEMTAFVGPSGAGKTTICSLIPRFYEVDEGAIKIDGIDIRQMTQSSLRKQIGIVQQDVFLFTGTIKENIAYGKLHATDEEIYDAAKRANLEEFIVDLSDGYETQIGERGMKLSGGQKQRLAIARMFLKNPPILILDEATSALDTHTELIIQEALYELAKDRTTLVIAHRLGTIKNADRIVVVTKDGISEDGKYDELVSANGRFTQLHNSQFRV